MNVVLMKELPPYKFEEISIDMCDWAERFLSLVREGKPIYYSLFAMPTIRTDIHDELSRRGYCQFIFNEDSWERFLFVEA